MKWEAKLTDLKWQTERAKRHETAVSHGRGRYSAQRAYYQGQTICDERLNNYCDPRAESPQTDGGLNADAHRRWAWTGSGWRSG